MMRHTCRLWAGVTYPLLILSIAAAQLAGCGGDSKEAGETGRTDTSAPVELGDITSFRLDNGINVYLREDRSLPQVAVMVLYRAGVIHEDKDDFHVSRLLPHMLIFSPTASFAANGAVDAVSKTGRVNGDVFGDYARFESSAASDQLDLLLKIEAERLTSVQFNEEQRAQFATKCRDDLDKVLEQSNLSISKYGLMALGHALNHSATFIPLRDGVNDVTIEDLERFHSMRYRLADMVLVVVGDFDTPSATDLIKRRLGSIEERPPVTESVQPAVGDINASWDIPSTVVFLVYPQPYQNETERLVMTMFGTYLTRKLRADPGLNSDVKSSLCTTTANPVGDIPFFVFAELRRGRTTGDVRRTILSAVNEAMEEIDERTFDTMKSNLGEFFELSVLESQRKVSSIPHHQALTREALDIGRRHYVRNGLPEDELLEMLDGITYEEAMRYLESRLAPENARTIVIGER